MQCPISYLEHLLIRSSHYVAVLAYRAHQIREVRGCNDGGHLYFGRYFSLPSVASQSPKCLIKKWAVLSPSYCWGNFIPVTMMSST
jgi:hypothetical protein